MNEIVKPLEVNPESLISTVVETEKKPTIPIEYKKHHKSCRGSCAYCRQLKESAQKKAKKKKKQTDYPWDEPSVLL